MGPKERDDKRFVRRLLDRDDEAFEEFFEAMYPALYRFALARLDGQREAAEDVAQSTLFRAIGKLETYRGEASLLTWLCTSAVTRSSRTPKRTDRWPQWCRSTTHQKSEPLSSRCMRLTPPDPHLALDRQQQASLIQRALDQLPPHYGSVLEWKYIDELPVQEIAERLGIRLRAANRCSHARDARFETRCSLCRLS